jgi:hypothetical protein
MTQTQIRVIQIILALAFQPSCAMFAAKPASSAATGTLEGKLTDTHSIPLGDATVIARNLATGETARSVTGKNGSYHFTGLGPGEYRLEADVPQLGKGAVDGILISAGHATRVQAALIMELEARPSQSALSEAELDALDPVTPAVTTTMAAEDMNALPLSTRNWQQFAALTPAGNPAPVNGSTQLEGQAGGQPEASSGEGLSLEGSNTGQTSSIDGIETPSGFHSPHESRATESFGANGSAGSIESIGESAVMALQTRTGDNPAESGRTPGGQISFITGQAHDGKQSGLHGQAFYLNRQSLWSAQNPFTQWIQQTAPDSGFETAQFTAEPYSPANSRQTFGLGVGSQLKAGKLFWFAAFDGLLSHDGAVATVRHPNDFFAQPTSDDLTVLSQRLDLPGPALLESAATLYSGWLSSLDGLLGPVRRTSSQGQAFARVDRQVGERHHLSVEGNAALLNAPAGGLTRTSETYGSHSFGNSQANSAWGLGKWNSFITANMLNSAGIEDRWSTEEDSPQSPSAFESSLIAASGGPLPEIVADSKYGFVLGSPARLGKSSYPDEHSFTAQDTVSWVHGEHLLKAGASFDHVADAVGTLVNQSGTYSYANALNFISDAASAAKYGLDAFAPGSYHNCDATGRVYSLGGGSLGGKGNLPCYAWYSQSTGPANWHLSTNDLAAFATEQWQPRHNLTVSAGVRIEAEQLPPAIAFVANPELPATQHLPSAKLNWGPRFGMAWSASKGIVFRVGAGLYYGRIDNSAVLAALTHTGSPYGDLNFFFKPTDNGAPPFPVVFSGQPQTEVVPGAVSFAPNFKPQEVDQAVVSLEQSLPDHWLISMSALASLGRRLPISIDTNLQQPIDSVTGKPQTITYAVVDAIQAGPIRSEQITVPFYAVLPANPTIENARVNPAYQQLASIESRANSTYDAAMIKLVRYGAHGLAFHAHYLYAHATDWNPNESGNVAVNDVLDPQDFRLEYGTSNLDIRHSAGATLLYETPWNLKSWAGAAANRWSISAVGQYRSGLPYTMRTGGSIPGFYQGSSTLLEGVGPGMNGSAGDNRVYGIGRNTYRYPATWTGDMRLGKRFNLAHSREIELLGESFNLFNHQNVTLLETTGYTISRGTQAGDLPTLNFLTGLTKQGLPSTTPEFGKPLDVNATNFYHPREFQLGVRARF